MNVNLPSSSRCDTWCDILRTELATPSSEEWLQEGGIVRHPVRKPSRNGALNYSRNPQSFLLSLFFFVYLTPYAQLGLASWAAAWSRQLVSWGCYRPAWIILQSWTNRMGCKTCCHIRGCAQSCFFEWITTKGMQCSLIAAQTMSGACNTRIG